MRVNRHQPTALPCQQQTEQTQRSLAAQRAQSAAAADGWNRTQSSSACDRRQMSRRADADKQVIKWHLLLPNFIKQEKNSMSNRNENYTIDMDCEP